MPYSTIKQSSSAINGHAQVVTKKQVMSHACLATPDPEALAKLGGTEVLLVEDSWHIAVAIQSVLETAGFVVAGPAGSLARAAALLDLRTPDVAIVDINIKGRMSYELIDRLIDRRIPVIVVSGYEKMTRLEDKVDAVLGKPVRAGVLLATLRRVLAERRAS